LFIAFTCVSLWLILHTHISRWTDIIEKWRLLTKKALTKAHLCWRGSISSDACCAKKQTPTSVSIMRIKCWFFLFFSLSAPLKASRCASHYSRIEDSRLVFCVLIRCCWIVSEGRCCRSKKTIYIKTASIKNETHFLLLSPSLLFPNRSRCDWCMPCD
jgi:hypothetical protein